VQIFFFQFFFVWGVLPTENRSAINLADCWLWFENGCLVSGGP
jgi:hypothetical protein